MAKFRRKQTEVEAVQFVDGRYGEAIDFCPTLNVNFTLTPAARATPALRTLSSAVINGDMPVNAGDWIVKGDMGFVVMTEAEFTSEYEAA